MWQHRRRSSPGRGDARTPTAACARSAWRGPWPSETGHGAPGGPRTRHPARATSTEQPGHALTPPMAKSARSIALPTALVPDVTAHLGQFTNREPACPSCAPRSETGQPVHPGPALARGPRQGRTSRVPLHSLRHTGPRRLRRPGTTLAELSAAPTSAWRSSDHPRPAAVRRKCAVCDPATKRAHAQSCALGCLGQTLELPSPWGCRDASAALPHAHDRPIEGPGS